MKQISQQPRRTGPRKSRPYRQLAIYTSVIFLLPSSLFAGFFVGQWFDSRFESGPWGKIVGLALGAVAGFVHLFRLIRK
ncbi:MAG TPA: AtpZ/AtpI family protein [Acidobacteriota bacterium]|nr:AtpZ/AtpI family protein [Acidobacteriota bacterium]